MSSRVAVSQTHARVIPKSQTSTNASQKSGINTSTTPISNKSQRYCVITSGIIIKYERGKSRAGGARGGGEGGYGCEFCRPPSEIGNEQDLEHATKLEKFMQTPTASTK